MDPYNVCVFVCARARLYVTQLDLLNSAAC